EPRPTLEVADIVHAARGEVIEDENLIPARQIGVGQMGADETGASGDQNAHDRSSLRRRSSRTTRIRGFRPGCRISCQDAGGASLAPLVLTPMLSNRSPDATRLAGRPTHPIPQEEALEPMLERPLVFLDIDTQRDFLEPSGALYVAGSRAILVNLEQLTR